MRKKAISNGERLGGTRRRTGGTPRPTIGTLPHIGGANRPGEPDLGTGFRLVRTAVPSSHAQPTWTPRALAGAACLTLLWFGSLPLAQVLNAPELDEWIALHPAELVAWTPPPLPLAEPEPQWERAPEPIRIDWPAPEAPAAEPPVVATDWAFALPAVPGDFGLSFGIGEWTVEGAIFTLADIDTPPRAMMQAPPMYPQSARQAGLEGVVEMAFVVTAEGRVTDVRVVESRPGTVFVSSAVHAVERWRFEPAQRRGEAVAVRVHVPLEFRMDR